jgi:hypothetical protein
MDHDTIRIAYESSDDDKLLDMIDNMTEEDVKFVADEVGKLICESDILIDCIDMVVQQHYVHKKEA